MLSGAKYEVTIQSVGPRGDLSAERSQPIELQARLLPPSQLEAVFVTSEAISVEWSFIEGMFVTTLVYFQFIILSV